MQPTIWDWPREWRGTAQSEFRLSPSSLSSSSPYTGELTPYGPQVQRFRANLTFPGMKPQQWRRVQGFITRLRGVTGLLRMVDYHRMKPARDQFDAVTSEEWFTDGSSFSDGTGFISGLLPPFVVVDVAAAEGADSIVLRGLPPNLAGVITLGDLGEVRPNGIPARHGHLYEIAADARTNADGKTRVYFEPGLRRKVAAGDMWVLRYPTSVFRLASDGEGTVSRSLGNVGNVGLALNEVLAWQ